MYKETNNKIIIGTANFGNKYGINKNKVLTKELKNIFNFLNQNNLRFLDTANNYGNSEKIIGKNIFKNKKKWKIITKVSKDKVDLNLKFLKTIKKLGTKPSVLMAHNSKDFLNANFRKKLVEIKEKHNVKVGVSIYTGSEINRVLKFNILDVIQLPISIVDQRLIKDNFLEKIKKRGIEIHARSIFFKGIIFKKKKFYKKNKYFYKLLESFEKNKKFSPAQISLNWILKQKHIDKVILGIDSLNQLKKNLSYVSSYNKKKSNNRYEIFKLSNKYLDLRKI